jgi:hypothetical protein
MIFWGYMKQRIIIGFSLLLLAGNAAAATLVLGEEDGFGWAWRNDSRP